jgi:hypothetical protein
MNTHPEDDFAQLRRLLSLKRHEAPPPGYLHRFPAEVISSLKAERQGRRQSARSENGPAWILRFVERLQARPALAGVVGAGLCALMIGGVVVNEKGGQRPTAMPSLLSEITTAPQPTAGAGSDVGAFQPVTADVTGTLIASNNLQGSPSPSLFDSIPGIDTATVGHQP